MAWGKAGRPIFKTCPGYEREAHRCNYDTDFLRIKRLLVDGTIVDYAQGPYCIPCRRAYERDLRRMNAKLAGRATRPQDVPWKKYRHKQDETFVRGLNARATRRPSEPFFEWFDVWIAKQGLSVEQVCRGVGVTSRTLRRWRQEGSLQLHTAEKFFVYAKLPHLTRVLYREGRIGKAA